MRKLFLSIAIVSALLMGVLLLPTAASAHTMTTNDHPTTVKCTYILTPVSNTTIQIVVHINDCLAQSLGTIGILPLATLLVRAGVEPGLVGSMASAMIANQGLIQLVDSSCGGGGVDASYSPILGISIGVVAFC